MNNGEWDREEGRMEKPESKNFGTREL